MIQFNDLLNAKAQKTDFCLTSSRQKNAFFDTICLQFGSVRMPSRMLGVAQNMADELLSNAFYNAPTDGTGNPLYRDWDRRREVVLVDAAAIEVELAISEQQWAIRVRDPFGSLTADAVRDNIARAATKDENQVHMGSGGAGLGLFMVLSAASRMVVQIAANQWTEIIATLEVRATHRNIEQKLADLQIIEVQD
jgi:hypothetical protein